MISEQLELFEPDQITGTEKMTLKEYSKQRGWPVPFGMKKKTMGYRVTFADGSATWMENKP